MKPGRFPSPKAIGPDRTYIDYFQGLPPSQNVPSNRFGIRVREGFCLVVVKSRDGEANACGKEFRIPVDLEMLPSHVRIIVDDHVLNDPASDLIDVLTGNKSFQQALNSPDAEVKRVEDYEINPFEGTKAEFFQGEADS